MKYLIGWCICLTLWNIYLGLKLHLYSVLHDDLEISLHLFMQKIGYYELYEKCREKITKK